MTTEITATIEDATPETEKTFSGAENAIPERPRNSFRVTLTLNTRRNRLDQPLLEELRKQKKNLALANISRTDFKELFKNKKIRIKGQSATPSSALAKGTTYIDILGFEEAV